MKVLRYILLFVREFRRWRNRHDLPHLVAEMAETPYWGGIELPVLVRNTGAVAVRDCRYCRRQRFTMDRGVSGAQTTALTWYATDSFRTPANGFSARQVAHATSDPCPRLVLADVPESAAQDHRFEAAIVCRDRFGTRYRFRFVDGQGPETDVWTESPLNGFFHREPPEWTKWVELPDRVENREWSSQFG